MKKNVSLILLIALITSITLGDIRTTAASSSKDFKYRISNSKAIITDYIGTGGAITIPSKLGGYPVLEIGYSAFEDNEEISSVVFPEGLTSIDLSAFSKCIKLSTIKLPSTLKSIGNHAFSNCAKLTDFFIPNNLYELGNGAFFGCNRLTSVLIPGSVKKCNFNTFMGCKGLTELNVDSTSTILSSIDGVLFNKSGTNLIQYPEAKTNSTYIFPANVTRIDDFAFSDSMHLISLIIPDNITQLGINCFDGCKTLTDITLGSGISAISTRAFYGCIALKSISNIITGNITTIGEESFHGCNALTSISISENVTTILGGAFADCSGITSISIANSVTNLGGAFYGCTALMSVKLPEGLEDIPSGCFRGCTSLESVKIPESLKNIEFEAFQGCTSLKSIIVPESVKILDDEAFEGCSSLTEITIPKSVNIIGEDAFNLCSSMTEINVDANNFKYSSFDGVLYNKTRTKLLRCPGGKEGTISIPSKVWKIGYKSFAYCLNISKITIPKNVTSIDIDAFFGCKNLTSVTFFEGLKYIYDGAFKLCTSLENIKLPKSLKYLAGHDQFQDCWSLKNIYVAVGNTYFSSVKGVLFNKSKTILYTYPAGRAGKYLLPKSTVRIDVGAFIHCKKLTSIVFQNGLKVIGNEAFAECTGLRSLTIPKTVTKIEDGAFLLCPDLKRVTFLGNAPIMGDGAFENSGFLKWYYIYGNKGFGKYDNPIIPKPTVKVSQQSSTSIKISWSNFKNATGYKVYRTTSRGGAYKTIKTVNGTSIIDTGLKSGKTYYYKVRVFAKLSATKYLFSNYSDAKRINMTTVIYGK